WKSRRRRSCTRRPSIPTRKRSLKRHRARTGKPAAAAVCSRATSRARSIRRRDAFSEPVVLPRGTRAPHPCLHCARWRRAGSRPASATIFSEDPMMKLDTILAETIDAATKGYPLSSPALPIFAIGAQRWSVLAGDLPLPLAVIRDSALAHNHAWMRDFTASTGVLLAPHGKTTMAPQIFAQQLAAGAWGITVVNVQQLGICVRFGVRRVIMANQLLGRAEVGAVIRLQESHPDLEFHFLIDSQAQLASIESIAGSQPMSRKLTALVELGVPGGRTGARTFDEALVVARAVAGSKAVALSGLEC